MASRERYHSLFAIRYSLDLMPLQNRVTPFGDVVADPHRGLFTGNRGIIHDPATKTLLRKRWSNPAWLVCVCEFRGRRRKVMGGRSWTELFFLDEATALAAGHRPCFYCRREDANRFRSCWEEGNGAADLLAPDIDAVLHRERYASGKQLHAMPSAVAQLPDGAMIAVDREAFIVIKGKPLLWTFAGYRKTGTPIRDAALLTPPSTLHALASGYRPVLHPSAR